MLNHSVWVHVCGASGSSHFLLNSSLRLRSGRSHGANWPKDATLNLVRYQSMKQNVPQISTCPWNMLQSITNSQGASGEPKGPRPSPDLLQTLDVHPQFFHPEWPAATSEASPLLPLDPKSACKSARAFCIASSLEVSESSLTTRSLGKKW